MDLIDVPSLLHSYNTLQEEYTRLTNEMKSQKERNMLLEARIKVMEQNEPLIPNSCLLQTPIFYVPVPASTAGPVITPNGQIVSDPRQFHNRSNAPAIFNTSVGNRGDGESYNEIRECEIDENVGNKGDAVPEKTVFHGLYPVLQEPILRHLSTFLDYSSIATGRLVCTYWNLVLTSIYKKRSKLNLDFSCSSTEEIEEFSGKLFSAYPISDFNAQKNLTSCLPLTISLIINPAKQHRGTQLIHKWLPTFGNKIKDIKITLGDEGTHISADMLKQMIDSCQNLETLRISEILLNGSLHKLEPKLFQNITTLDIGHAALNLQSRNQVTSYGPEVIESMKDILQSVPNLRTLRLNPRFVKAPHKARFVECFAICQKTGYMENLSELELRNSIVTNETLDVLSKVKFTSLKRLTLETDFVIKSNTAGQALTDLLINVRGSLEQLRIGMTILLDLEVNNEIPNIPNQANINEINVFENFIPLGLGNPINPQNNNQNPANINGLNQIGNLFGLGNFGNQIEVNNLNQPNVNALNLLAGVFNFDNPFNPPGLNPPIARSSITIESLPEMTNIKQLEMCCDLSKEPGSIDFLQKFPNLETLILWEEEGDEDAFLRLIPVNPNVNINFKHNSLRVLKMPRTLLKSRSGISGEHQNLTLVLIVTCFPRLEVLSLMLRGFEDMHLSKSLKILNDLTELQELSIYHEGLKDYDFNHSMAKMFKSNKLAFWGLKRFRFFNFNEKKVWLNASTFQKNLKYAQSLQYLELNNFRILETEKDSILNAVKKINRVRFLHCETVSRIRLGNNNQPPRQSSDIHEDADEDSDEDLSVENLMIGGENNCKNCCDWTFEVGTSIDVPNDLSLGTLNSSEISSAL